MTEKVLVRMPLDMHTFLTKVSKERDITIPEVIRRLISDEQARQKKFNPFRKKKEEENSNGKV